LDSSLESFHFRRSTTGKRKRKEGEYNILFAFEIRERKRFARNGGGQFFEAGRNIADFEMGLSALGKKRSGGDQTQK